MSACGRQARLPQAGRPWQSPVQSETPLAERVFGMRVRRSEETFHPDPFINLLGEACELASVHLFADELSQTFSESGLLGGTGWNSDDDFVLFFLNLITHEEMPGEES